MLDPRNILVPRQILNQKKIVKKIPGNEKIYVQKDYVPKNI